MLYGVWKERHRRRYVTNKREIKIGSLRRVPTFRIKTTKSFEIFLCKGRQVQTLPRSPKGSKKEITNDIVVAGCKQRAAHTEVIKARAFGDSSP
jgi:hypothetical protein